MSNKQTKEKIIAFGHENVQAVHPSTLMFTKEKYLSNNGDCIIAVAADKALSDLNPTFKAMLKKPEAKLTMIIEVDGLTEEINSFGSPLLILTHSTDVVVRKSGYISDRTLAIQADKSSNDLARELIEKLKNPKQKINITLIVDG